MNDMIAQALKGVADPTVKRLVLAEWMQHLILQSVYRNDLFGKLVFTGGTALRLLYQTGRFSEDLDFSLLRKKGFKFTAALEKIQRDLKSQHCGFEFYAKEEKKVARADFRFPNLLQQYGLSPLKNQKLTIKFEIDTHPPAGGKTEMALVAQPISYTVCVFDLPSLFATKLHALFYRGYTKGRDYYDLVWYLGRRVKPNFNLLNRAIRQTEGAGHEIHEEDFNRSLSAHLKKIDFNKAQAEVSRFLIHTEEVQLLDRALIQNLLERHYAV